ncbi:MAG: HAMP domain-containing histidine kinase [Candidatus Krumholzibacteriota bacterium]|nr:HAMP domain-containing histidine kinase [Candidatus Krumholzibacteriota bacterium]
MRSPRNLPFLLRVYLVAGVAVLVAAALWYNGTMIGRMQAQSNDLTRLFSRFIAIELRDIRGDDRRAEFVTQVRNAISVPFVVSDISGRPMIWNGIGVEQVGDDEYFRLTNFDPDAPNDPLLERVLERARMFDRINDPIRIEGDEVSLVLHHGTSRLQRELAVAPYVQIAVLALFLLFGFLMFRALKQNEQRSIWVGMAKETAHQLGTPLSSIMGWLAMIQEETAEAEVSENVQTAMREVEADVDRLVRISSRFGKIGSAPKLEYHKIAPIIEDTVDYFERRRPSLRIGSTISVDLEELPLVRCSADLLGWVFENLVKNSLDAIDGEGGSIAIVGRMNPGEKRVEITFSDNGKGMTASQRNRIFTPGYTTKSRGWGLGLALVRRIVEEIHGGSIRVTHTLPGKGTTFLITFPVD